MLGTDRGGPRTGAEPQGHLGVVAGALGQQSWAEALWGWCPLTVEGLEWERGGRGGAGRGAASQLHRRLRRVSGVSPSTRGRGLGGSAGMPYLFAGGQDPGVLSPKCSPLRSVGPPEVGTALSLGCSCPGSAWTSRRRSLRPQRTGLTPVSCLSRLPRGPHPVTGCAVSPGLGWGQRAAPEEAWPPLSLSFGFRAPGASQLWSQQGVQEAPAPKDPQ